MERAVILVISGEELAVFGLLVFSGKAVNPRVGFGFGDLESRGDFLRRAAVIDDRFDGERARELGAFEEQAIGGDFLDDGATGDRPSGMKIGGSFCLDRGEIGDHGDHRDEVATVPGLGRLESERGVGNRLFDSDGNVLGFHAIGGDGFELEDGGGVGVHPSCVDGVGVLIDGHDGLAVWAFEDPKAFLGTAGLGGDGDTFSFFYDHRWGGNGEDFSCGGWGTDERLEGVLVLETEANPVSGAGDFGDADFIDIAVGLPISIPVSDKHSAGTFEIHEGFGGGDELAIDVGFLGAVGGVSVDHMIPLIEGDGIGAFEAATDVEWAEDTDEEFAAAAFHAPAEEAAAPRSGEFVVLEPELGGGGRIAGGIVGNFFPADHPWPTVDEIERLADHSGARGCAEIGGGERADSVLRILRIVEMHHGDEAVGFVEDCGATGLAFGLRISPMELDDLVGVAFDQRDANPDAGLAGGGVPLFDLVGEGLTSGGEAEICAMGLGGLEVERGLIEAD